MAIIRWRFLRRLFKIGPIAWDLEPRKWVTPDRWVACVSAGVQPWPSKESHVKQQRETTTHRNKFVHFAV